MSRLARIALPITLAAALALPALAIPASSGASNLKASPVKILACTGTTLSRPRNFVISCADANAALTQTHWSTWSANRATGTTRFALNLCTPYCAASPMSYFPHSTVTSLGAGHDEARPSFLEARCPLHLPRQGNFLQLLLDGRPFILTVV